MNNDNPKISIIVPCYNQAQYLSEALQSVLTQTYTNWECVIVNDGSPDETEQIAKKWERIDTRFKYFYKENGGLSSARNFGIERSKGVYILPLDADDKIGGEYIERALIEFIKNKNLSVVYCEALKFGEKVEKWILKQFTLYDLALNNMIFCSAIFRKEDWVKLGGYDLNMKFGFEDWEFWINLLKKGGNVFKLNYTGFYYRVKNESMLTNISSEKKEELLKYMSEKHADFYVSQLGSYNKLAKQNLRLINNEKKRKCFLSILFQKLK